MSAAEIIGYCLSAFGIGYAAGSAIRTIRKAFEVAD